MANLNDRKDVGRVEAVLRSDASITLLVNNAGVGRATVAIAKSLGLRTVNVVRCDEVVAEMKALGGDVVLVDGPDLAQRVAAETGNAPITLALDGVSDISPMHLMSCLSESGVLV